MQIGGEFGIINHSVGFNAALIYAISQRLHHSMHHHQIINKGSCDGARSLEKEDLDGTSRMRRRRRIPSDLRISAKSVRFPDLLNPDFMQIRGEFGIINHSAGFNALIHAVSRDLGYKFCYQTAPELSLLCFVRSDWEKMAPKFSSITPAQLISLRRSAKVAIVDVRDDERSFLHIAGSHHYGSKSFCERIPNLVAAVRDDECVVFHCTLSEVRGPACAQMFIEHLSNMKEDYGIKEVMILEGGFSAWLAPGRPICRCTDSPCKAQSA